MNGPRSSSLLVYLMALLILLAFLLALTLVVTSGPFSDPSDNYRIHAPDMSGNSLGNTSQCVVSGSLSVQETCPEAHIRSTLWDVFGRG